MQPYYLLSVCLLISATIIAQRKPLPYKNWHNSYREGRLFVKLNVLPIFDPQIPTLQPGLEYRLSKNLTVDVAIGLPVRVDKDARTTDSTWNNYYKLRGELRFFPKGRGIYFAPEFFYVNRRHHKTNGTFVGKDGIDYRFTEGTIEKNVTGTAIKVGGMLPLSSRWYVDVSLGSGLRFINTTIDAVGIQRERRGFELFEEREGRRKSPHVTGGAKITYRIY